MVGALAAAGGGWLAVGAGETGCDLVQASASRSIVIPSATRGLGVRWRANRGDPPCGARPPRSCARARDDESSLLTLHLHHILLPAVARDQVVLLRVVAE